VRPVPRVARESRGVDAQDDAHLPQRHLGQHPLKTRPLGKAARRDAEVVLKHLRLDPAHRKSLLPQATLQPRALGVIAHLLRIRLAHVHDGRAVEVTLGNAMIVNEKHHAPP